MSVNSEMTALADAIREKSGRTGQMGIAAMKEAVKGISAGIDTSDATATAADIASGKTAYVGGHKITGSVTSYDSQTGWNNVTPVVSGDNLRLSRDTNIPYLFRKGFYLGAPLSKLGDASASDVAKGKTFTSASGLKLTGTFEGGGLPDGVTEMNTGSFTPTSDISEDYYISHGLSRAPNFYFVFIENDSMADIGEGYLVLEDGTALFGAIYQRTHYLWQGEYISQWISDHNETGWTTTIKIRPDAETKLKAGETYHWVAGVHNLLE